MIFKIISVVITYLLLLLLFIFAINAIWKSPMTLFLSRENGGALFCNLIPKKGSIKSKNIKIVY